MANNMMAWIVFLAASYTSLLCGGWQMADNMVA
jgi:hypothetical protein